MLITQTIQSNALIIERGIPYTSKGSKSKSVMDQIAAMKIGESFACEAGDSGKYYSMFARLKKETAYRKQSKNQYAGQYFRNKEGLQIRFWRIA